MRETKGKARERERGSEDERMQGDEGEGEIEQAAKHQIKLWGRQL